MVSNKKYSQFFNKILLTGITTLALWFVYGHFVMPLFVGDKQETFTKFIFTWYFPITAGLFVFKPRYLLQKITAALVLAAFLVFGLIGVLGKLGML